MLKIRLQRDLRKSILRGHPWVYRQSLQDDIKADKAQMCEVLDKKGQFVAWAIYDPHSVLALRCLSTAKRPPNQGQFEKRFAASLEIRKQSLSQDTNTFRLFNGEGDRLPGVVCDVYDQIAVLQFDGQGPYEFWDQEWIADWLLKNNVCESVIFKPRKRDTHTLKQWGKEITSPIVELKENGRVFYADLFEGQKTGFFIDQRDNREYLSQFTKGKTFLNLFSYSGGFSIYAGVAGAKSVDSVDIAPGALELADKAWAANNLESTKHQSHCQDVFEFLQTTDKQWDTMVVDPPSMTHSEKLKDKAVYAYTDLFSKAIARLKPNGHLFLSSCSSHISFDDFFEIISEALSKTRKTGRILRVSGQGFDHPYPHSCPELRYLKFVHLCLEEPLF